MPGGVEVADCFRAKIDYTHHPSIVGINPVADCFRAKIDYTIYRLASA